MLKLLNQVAKASRVAKMRLMEQVSCVGVVLVKYAVIDKLFFFFPYHYCTYRVPVWNTMLFRPPRCKHLFQHVVLFLSI